MRHLLLATALLLTTGANARTQEAINTSAATQPGVGRITVREQLRYLRGDLPTRTGRAAADELVLQSSVFAGIRHDLTLGADLPLSLRDSDGGGNFDDDSGELNAGDLRLLGKWRFWRHDTGPIDTQRASLLFGVQLDTGDGTSLLPGFARDSTDPILGAVYTRVTGRHGINAAWESTISTGGDADDHRYDGAYLFRLAPAQYAADTTGAWYVVGELNGRYASNGDHELLLSPGLMYEARRWTAELSVQLPALQELDHRAELDFGIVLGLRLLF